MINPGQQIKEVMALYPATAEIFRSYGLDACCGGAHSIELAARARGVALDMLLEELDRAARA